jgi:hypothetical protein
MPCGAENLRSGGRPVSIAPLLLGARAGYRSNRQSLALWFTNRPRLTWSINDHQRLSHDCGPSPSPADLRRRTRGLVSTPRDAVLSARRLSATVRTCMATWPTPGRSFRRSPDSLCVLRAADLLAGRDDPQAENKDQLGREYPGAPRRARFGGRAGRKRSRRT